MIHSSKVKNGRKKRHPEIVFAFCRRRAVKLMQQGEPKETISRILGVSRNFLNVWLRKANAGESLTNKHIPGRPRRLSDRQLGELEKLLKSGATSHGWENNLWTSRRVREVIKKAFNIKFSRSGALHILKNYLHWSAIKPTLRAAARDDAEISRWLAEEFPRIERQAGERSAHLAFVDESGFMMTPTIRRTFAPRGSTPVSKVFNPHGRISVSGAITISPSRTIVGLHCFMLTDNVSFRGPNVIDFLKHLRNQICGPITIIWDQIMIHSSDVVLEYLRAFPDITTESFPPYAPELNPVDRAWFYLKYNRLANYTPATTVKLRRAVRGEIKRLQNKPDLLRSFILQTRLPLTL
jgi:transposase